MRTTLDSQPKYMQIIHYLRAKIDAGELKPGDRIPTETELMEQFRVSRIVVINAMTKLADEEVIVRYPGKGSFVLDRPAAPLVSPHPHGQPFLALVLAGITDTYSIQLAQEINAQAHKRDMLCSIYHTCDNCAIETDIIRHLDAQGCSGIVLFPSNQETYNKELVRVWEKGFPIVLIDRDLSGLRLSCVQTDHKQATRIATAHLLDLGHRSIAICSITPMPTLSVSQRIDGYLEEMGNRNQLVDPSLIITSSLTDDYNKQLDAIIEKKAATAFICLNISDYQLVVKRIEKYGLSYPEDFSIVTFDDPRIFPWQKPHPTMILQNAPQIIGEACRILFQMIDSKDYSVEKVLIPPIFVEGSTTRPL